MALACISSYDTHSDRLVRTFSTCTLRWPQAWGTSCCDQLGSSVRGWVGEGVVVGVVVVKAGLQTQTGVCSLVKGRE